MAACIEEHFAHSIATAIVKQAKEEGLKHEEDHSEVEYIVAHGIVTEYNGKRVVIGSKHFLFDDEKVKATKTQESYQLLTGKLVRKMPSVDYEVNAEALAKWLNENGREDLVKVTVAHRWGDLKKLLTGDTESGVVTIASTGEVVEGVKAVENPEKFTIKFTEKE
jgi:cation transport ATPase